MCSHLCVSGRGVGVWGKEARVDEVLCYCVCMIVAVCMSIGLGR